MMSPYVFSNCLCVESWFHNTRRWLVGLDSPVLPQRQCAQPNNALSSPFAAEILFLAHSVRNLGIRTELAGSGLDGVSCNEEMLSDSNIQ